MFEKFYDAYDGRALQQWLYERNDICLYIAAAYLTFVFAGPPFIEKYLSCILNNKDMVKRCWVLWNLGLSIFSMWGSYIVVPVAYRHVFKDKTNYDAVCVLKEDEFFTGRMGLALGAFAISKLPEFADTVFLLFTGKKKLPFLSWFHHVTVFIFAWQAYVEGSSIFIYCAAMNYTVHAIMYMYFALAELGYKKLVRPFAMYITLIQILQMVGGLTITGIALYEKTKAHNFAIFTFDNHVNKVGGCPGVSLSCIRAQMGIYIANFYLFSEMFVKAYILPPPAARKE